MDIYRSETPMDQKLNGGSEDLQLSLFAFVIVNLYHLLYMHLDLTDHGYES